MAKPQTFSGDFLKLILNATTITGIAQNAASPNTNVFVALHTADPSAGTQSTSEISYTGYARVGVARTTGGWTVTSNAASPAASVTFGASTGGTGGTASFWSVGELTSGTGKIFWSGAISPAIVVTSGITPILTSASTITES